MSLATARQIHEQKLVDLIASPEPADAFEAAMRRGSIEYRKSALRAIDKLEAREQKAAECAK